MGLRKHLNKKKHLNVTDDDDDEEDNVSNCEDDELQLRVGNGNFVGQKHTRTGDHIYTILRVG